MPSRDFLQLCEDVDKELRRDLLAADQAMDRKLNALKRRWGLPEIGPVKAATKPEAHEGLLTADDIATVLAVDRHRVYRLARRADWNPFTLRLGRKTLRFRADGFRRWQDRQTGGR